MIKDAVIKETSEKIEVFSPKFRYGQPIFHLDKRYLGYKVKLVTEKVDIPTNYEVFVVNGVTVTKDQFGNMPFTAGTFVAIGNIVYVVVAEPLLR